MSRRVSRRRPHKKNSAAHAVATGSIPAPAPSLQDFEFIPIEDLPVTRRKPGTERLPKALRQPVALSSGPGAAFAQRENVPPSIVPGASALATFLADPGTAPGDIELDDEMMDFMCPTDFDPERDGVRLGVDKKRRHGVRRAAQHATWRHTVIPSLVQPFLCYVHGRAPRVVSIIDCPCSRRRTVTILLADWEDTRQHRFTVCRCLPAATQLVNLGYFPCAPKRPSMAFSLRLLEFISLHSLHVAPNHTAWAATLEAFWARRGFVVEESRGFRKRLANAVHWYQVLVDQKDAAVTAALNDVRNSLSTKRRSEGDSMSTQATKRRRIDRTGESPPSAQRTRGGHDADGATNGHATRLSAQASRSTPLEDADALTDGCARDNADTRNDGRASEARPGSGGEASPGSGGEASPRGRTDGGAQNDGRARENTNAQNDTRPGRVANGGHTDTDAKNDGRARENADAQNDTRAGHVANGGHTDTDAKNDGRTGRTGRTGRGAEASRGRTDAEAKNDTRNEVRPQIDARSARGAQVPIQRHDGNSDKDDGSREHGLEGGTTPRHHQSRPSDYLRARCPLCFGGSKPVFQHTSAHAIVCLDANFAQKRRKSKETDPPLAFADSRFVSPAEVDAMEQEVEEKRKRPSKGRRKSKAPVLDDEVLDECESSFLAAQENVTKASKNYYADTGLMALLCRHDRVLYIVNMTTPGERQHYALALLRKLFEGLPADWNVGVLYDIACQLSRSIAKHDLLADYADRLVFGVSVFHAYGHQWACQLVFHPRKRNGFGLTDGEGCERFWSSIRHLISCLRVSGFFRRLFVLDRQMQHIDAQGLFKLGRWLSKRWSDTSQKLLEAERKLALCGVEQDVLRAQWQAQVGAQVASIPRQSKHAGDKQIDKILLDLALVDELREQSKQDRATLKKSAHILDPLEVQRLVNRIEAAKHDVQAARARVATAQSQLGTGSLRKFEQLRGDAYIRARVNARALRVRIRMAVQAHKFEREKLERNLRRQIMQNKDHAQTRDLVHSREKSITALVRKFNNLVDQIEILLRDGPRSRRRLAAPRKLDTKKLFRLDIDDDIWQPDPGLGPQDEGGLPRWQVDEDVRAGIRHMLDVDRCREERERLRCEAAALRTWWQEECRVIEHFRAVSDDSLIAREVSLRQRHLEQLAAAWTQALALTDIATTFVRRGAPGDSGRVAEVAPREDAPSPRADAPPPRADAPPPRADAPSPRADAPSPRADVDDAPTGDLDGSDLDGSDSEGSFYMSGDDVTDAGEDEYDAHLLDMAMDACGDGSDDDGEGSGPVKGTHIDDGDSRATSTVISSPRTTAAAEHTPPPTLPVSSKLKSAPIEISSDSGNGSDSEIDARKSRPRMAERGRTAGPYMCIGEDVARMASRTAWLSGSGLAVFAESKLLASGRTTIGHCPSTVLVDVQAYLDAKAKNDAEKAAKNYDYVWKEVKQLPHPETAEAWLVVAHVSLPEHWTLVEVCWRRRELRFYDSLRAEKSYDMLVKAQTLGLLEMCEKLYGMNLGLAGWKWIGEQREVRQKNWYDCGPFVAADFVSLVTLRTPSVLGQGDMRRWREEMTAHMRTLPQNRATARAPLTAEQLASALNVDDE